MNDIFVPLLTTYAFVIGFGPAIVGLCDIVILVYLAIRFTRKKNSFFMPVLLIASFVAIGYFVNNLGAENNQTAFSLFLVLAICFVPLLCLVLSIRRVFLNREDKNSIIEIVFLIPISIYAVLILIPWMTA